MIYMLEVFLKENVLWIASFHILLIGFFFILSFKQIKKEFEKINKKTWFLLVAILIFSTFIFFRYNLRFAVVSDNWWDVFVAKELSINYLEPFLHYKYSYGFVFPLTVLFSFLGFNPEVVSFLTISTGILTSLFLFSSSYLLFKDEKTALLTALIPIFIPHIIFFTSILKGKAIIGLFCITASLFFTLLASKRFTKETLTLALLVVIFTAQIKPEYGMLFYLFLLSLYVFQKERFKRENLKKTLKKFCIPVLIFIPFALYYTFSFLSRAFGNFISGGFLFHQSIQGAPSTNYFLGMLAQLFKYWTSNQFYPFLPFLFIGFLYCFYGNTRYKKRILFLIAGFFLINLPYLTYYPYTYESRFAISSFSFLGLIIGLGFGKFLSYVSRYVGSLLKLDKKYIISIISVLILIITVLIQIPIIKRGYEITRNNQYFKEQDYTIVQQFEKNILEEEPLIIVPHFNTKWMWKAMSSYRVESFDHSDEIVGNKINRLIYQQNIKYNESKQYPINIPKESPKYFLYTSRCKSKQFKHFWFICKYIMDHYSLEKIAEHKGIKLYKFKE